MNNKVIDDAVTWLKDKALPLWDTVARDEHGGTYEHLHMDGTPDKDYERRHRINARQMYAYALADYMGWYKGEPVARELRDYMVKFGYQVDGKPGFIHRLNGDYSVKSDLRDTYDHDFYLLGLGWHYRVSKDMRSLELISEITEWMDRELWDAKTSSWLEGKPASLPRRTNPHMHFFETSLALYDALEDESWLARADQMYALFKNHFFDEKTGSLLEFFNDDWSQLEGEQGRSVEPGHHMEWVWILRNYGKRRGVDVSDYANALYETALRTGVHEDGVFLVDETNTAGQIVRGSRRCWPQTELIKAHVAQAEAGLPHAGEQAIAALDGLMREYMRPDGGWIDSFDEKGRPNAKYMPASTFYHVICAIAEADRVLNK